MLAAYVLSIVGCYNERADNTPNVETTAQALVAVPNAEAVAQALANNPAFVRKVARNLATNYANQLRGQRGPTGAMGPMGPQGESGLTVPYTLSCPAGTTEVILNGHLVYCYGLLPTAMTWQSCLLACPHTGMEAASLEGMMLACSANANALPLDSAPDHGQFWIGHPDYAVSLIPEVTSRETNENCGFCEVVNAQNFDATGSNPSCQRQDTNGYDTWTVVLDPWSFRNWSHAKNTELFCMCGTEPR
jgi:hypothetical protein